VGQSFKFNSWVQVGISRSDYVRAKTDAAQKLRDKAIRNNDQEAKTKAMQLLENLREHI